jgi:23S rRNA (cytosine1962-C5)-methyltransferase
MGPSVAAIPPRRVSGCPDRGSGGEPRQVLVDHGVVTGHRGYQLIDCGRGRRLEQFGDRVVDRPAPLAYAPSRATRDAWAAADLRFEREGGWSGPLEPWTIALEGMTLELRPTGAGQVGLYPEHLRFQASLVEGLAGLAEPAVLHLFASTGATTLALARAGAHVAHVDGARSSVAWARRNAELSGLADAPVRWIVDDALEFTRREARRGRRYAAIVLDPPSYGHGPDGRRWQLRDSLPELLDAVAAVADDEAVVLLTAHTEGLTTDDLAEALDDAFHGRGTIAAERVELTATSEAVLPSGIAARMILR